MIVNDTNSYNNSLTIAAKIEEFVRYFNISYVGHPYIKKNL